MSEAFSRSDSAMGRGQDVPTREQHAYLDDDQWSVLEKMDAINGRNNILELLAHGPDEVIARVARFRQYEVALEQHIVTAIGAASPPQVVVSQAPAPTVVVQPPATPSGPKSLRVKISPFSGNENENLIFWQREVELALVAGCVTDERQRITLAISHMADRAKNWALTCETTQPGCFQDWATLTSAMQAMFLPPNVAYHQRVAFLNCKQGERELYAYVQELRQLRASMASNSLPEEVMVAILMEGMKFGSPKTALFREGPKSLEEAIAILLREDHVERQARSLPTDPLAPGNPPAGGPEPMDLSMIDLSDVDLSTFDLSAIDSRALHIKCFTCDKMGHFQRNCPRSRGQRGQSRFFRGRGRGARSSVYRALVISGKRKFPVDAGRSAGAESSRLEVCAQSA